MRRRIAAHLSLLVVGAVILRVALVPAEWCPPVTAIEVAESAHATVDWIVDNQDGSGRYLYGWDRDEGEASPRYNEARHAGVTMSLYQAYGALGRPDVLEAADLGIAFTLSDIHESEGWSAWRPHGDPQTGSNGLLLVALALRRAATGDPVHDDLMRGIGEFLLAVQQPDGSIFSAWDLQAGAPRPTYGPFATGEASWALALLDHAFPGEGWGEAAARTVDYMATDRNAVEGHLASLPDHWAAYTISELRSDLLTEDRLDFARRLSGYFGVRLRFEAQRRGTGINLWLRWYPGPPAGVGTAGEGIGALWDLAGRDSRLADIRPGVAEALTCMAGYQYERQVLDADARVEEYGAWFYRGYTQMDDQQHVLSVLLAALRTMEEDA